MRFMDWGWCTVFRIYLFEMFIYMCYNLIKVKGVKI